MYDTQSQKSIEHTEPIQYFPRLYANGFSSFPQRMQMEVAWREVFKKNLPRDYWHPKDFHTRFLEAVPVGQRSKYRISKPIDFPEDEGMPIAMGIFFLLFGKLLGI